MVHVHLKDGGGVENEPCHAPLDIAAGLAEDALSERQDWASARAELHEEIRETLEEIEAPGPLQDAVDALYFGQAEAIRFGARLGYALAVTEPSMRYGWARWLAAAEAELEQVGCSQDEHYLAQRRAMLQERAALTAARNAVTRA